MVSDPVPFIGSSHSSSDATRHELVFVSTDVPNYRAILRDLTRDASQDGRLFEVVVLRPNVDGLLQVTEALARMRDQPLSAVHFVTHASGDGVKLGDFWLTDSNIVANRELILAWKQALSDDADLLFYGCDLAGTLSGQRLLNALHDLTGADVAASTDLTGAANLGGDWNLEFIVGEIETDLALSQQLQSEYSGTLATFMVTTTLDVGPGSLRQAIINANANTGPDTIQFAIGSGLKTIQPLSALPTITDAVVIDATTQPGYSGSPLIELRGTSAGASSGFDINGNNVTIRGFVINDFKTGGIDIQGSGHVIQGNYIGTDTTGKNPLSNSKHGIRVGFGALPVMSRSAARPPVPQTSLPSPTKVPASTSSMARALPFEATSSTAMVGLALI
jgi:hypothetical protein